MRAARALSASPSEALPRKERIAKRRDFVRAYEDGTKQFGRFSVVFSCPNGLGHPRIGITATRKIGNAVVRNRARRWVREVYRRNRGPIGLSEEPFDFVVNIKASAAEAGFDEFARDLVRTIRRAAELARQAQRRPTS